MSDPQELERKIALQRLAQSQNNDTQKLTIRHSQEREQLNQAIKNDTRIDQHKEFIRNAEDPKSNWFIETSRGETQASKLAELDAHKSELRSIQSGYRDKFEDMEHVHGQERLAQNNWHNYQRKAVNESREPIKAVRALAGNTELEQKFQQAQNRSDPDKDNHKREQIPKAQERPQQRQVTDYNPYHNQDRPASLQAARDEMINPNANRRQTAPEQEQNRPAAWHGQQGQNMVEREQLTPRPTPPRGIGQVVDNQRHMRELGQEQRRYHQEPQQTQRSEQMPQPPRDDDNSFDKYQNKARDDFNMSGGQAWDQKEIERER